MKTKTHSFIPFYIFIISLVGFMSCGNHKNEDLKIFRYNQIGGLESLDPAFAKNLAIMWTSKFLFNTLVEIDSQLNIQPSLAKHWHISDDHLTYTFRIRNDVYFHDNPIFHEGKGRKMTAHDIVYSFNRIIDPQTASSGAWIFNDKINPLHPFSAPNDTTLIVRLRQPFGPFLQILSMPYCSIVPHEIVKHFGKDFRNHPCGTGPFQLKLWDEGNALLLQKNEQYWEADDQGERLPYLDGVEVSFNETRAMEFLLFKQKKIHFINGIDGSMKDIILTKNGDLKKEYKEQFDLNKHLYLNTEYLGITLGDTKNNLLNDRRLREAINLGIDKEKLVKYFRNGIGVAAQNGFVPINMPGIEKDNVQQNYQPHEAKKLVDDFIRTSQIGKPMIKLSTPEVNVDICNFIATQLNEIGFNASIEVMQPSLLRQLMSKGEIPLFKAQWIADYPDAESYFACFYSKYPAPPNYTRYKNAHFDALYEKSIQITDDDKRYDYYKEMNKIISSEYNVIPLFYDQMLHFTQKNLTGLRTNALNIISITRVQL